MLPVMVPYTCWNGRAGVAGLKIIKLRKEDKVIITPIVDMLCDKGVMFAMAACLTGGRIALKYWSVHIYA